MALDLMKVKHADLTKLQEQLAPTPVENVTWKGRIVSVGKVCLDVIVRVVEFMRSFTWSLKDQALAKIEREVKSLTKVTQEKGLQTALHNMIDLEKDMEVRIKLNERLEALQGFLASHFNENEKAAVLNVSLDTIRKDNKTLLLEDQCYRLSRVASDVEKTHLLKNALVQDIKEKTTAPINDLIKFAYTDGTLNLKKSLGEYLGVYSTENRTLISIALKDFSTADQSEVNEDARTTIDLISKAYVQKGMDLPEHIRNRMKPLIQIAG